MSSSQGTVVRGLVDSMAMEAGNGWMETNGTIKIGNATVEMEMEMEMEM